MRAAPEPDWNLGACTTHPDPDLWSAPRPSLRQAAVRVCSTCPVLAACRSWALTLPVSEPAVYGGMLAAERRRARQQLRAAEQARLAADQAAQAPSGHPGALRAALDELRLDPARSDRLVAEAAGVNFDTVRRARALDPAALAPLPSARARRSRPPLPRHPSLVRDLILQGASTREITARAGVSRQAVWAMRRSLAA